MAIGRCQSHFTCHSSSTSPSLFSCVHFLLPIIIPIPPSSSHFPIIPPWCSHQTRDGEPGGTSRAPGSSFVIHFFVLCSRHLSSPPIPSRRVPGQGPQLPAQARGRSTCSQAMPEEVKGLSAAAPGHCHTHDGPKICVQLAACQSAKEVNTRGLGGGRECERENT